MNEKKNRRQPSVNPACRKCPELGHSCYGAEPEVEIPPCSRGQTQKALADWEREYNRIRRRARAAIKNLRKAAEDLQKALEGMGP